MEDCTTRIIASPALPPWSEGALKQRTLLLQMIGEYTLFRTLLLDGNRDDLAARLAIDFAVPRNIVKGKFSVWSIEVALELIFFCFQRCYKGTARFWLSAAALTFIMNGSDPVF